MSKVNGRQIFIAIFQAGRVCFDRGGRSSALKRGQTGYDVNGVSTSGFGADIHLSREGYRDVSRLGRSVRYTRFRCGRMLAWLLA